MKPFRKLFYFTAVIFIFSFSSYTLAKEPPNLGLQKYQVIRYYMSGEYQHDVKSVIDKAQKYLATRIAENKNSDGTYKKKLAMVLDIDDTSLCSYNFMGKLTFGGTMDEIHKGYANNYFPAIPETLALYNYAKQNNVAVFFVTGRHDESKARTEEVLHKAGYKNWDKMYFEQADYKTRYNSIAKYKSSMRQLIEANGYDIVLNIGDQFSDLAGGFADKAYKLPNPMYFLQ